MSMSNKKFIAIAIIALTIAAVTSITYAIGLQAKNDAIMNSRKSTHEFWDPQAEWSNRYQTTFFDFDTDNTWGDEGQLQWYHIMNFCDYVRYVDLYIREVLHKDPETKMLDNQKYLEVPEEVSDGWIKFDEKHVYVYYNVSLLEGILNVFYEGA